MVDPRSLGALDGLAALHDLAEGDAQVQGGPARCNDRQGGRRRSGWRRHQGPGFLPLVLEAHPLHQEEAQGGVDLRLERGHVVRDLDVGVLPGDNLQSGRLALETRRLGAHEVSLAQVEEPAVAVGGHGQRARLALHLQELEKGGQREVFDATLDALLQHFCDRP
jgi:hypothetical protein